MHDNNKTRILAMLGLIKALAYVRDDLTTDEAVQCIRDRTLLKRLQAFEGFALSGFLDFPERADALYRSFNAYLDNYDIYAKSGISDSGKALLTWLASIRIEVNVDNDNDDLGY